MRVALLTALLLSVTYLWAPIEAVPLRRFHQVPVSESQPVTESIAQSSAEEGVGQTVSNLGLDSELSSNPNGETGIKANTEGQSIANADSVHGEETETSSAEQQKETQLRNVANDDDILQPVEVAEQNSASDVSTDPNEAETSDLVTSSEAVQSSPVESSPGTQLELGVSADVTVSTHPSADINDPIEPADAGVPVSPADVNNSADKPADVSISAALKVSEITREGGAPFELRVDPSLMLRSAGKTLPHAADVSRKEATRSFRQDYNTSPKCGDPFLLTCAPVDSKHFHSFSCEMPASGDQSNRQSDDATWREHPDPSSTIALNSTETASLDQSRNDVRKAEKKDNFEVVETSYDGPFDEDIFTLAETDDVKEWGEFLIDEEVAEEYIVKGGKDTFDDIGAEFLLSGDVNGPEAGGNGLERSAGENALESGSGENGLHQVTSGQTT